MNSGVYMNEWERFPANWLRALYPAATVDERSISDVGADELSGYERCHFFAGIGGWEYALELAGWPAGVPVWTGSCPCQPFSAAGKGLGEKDPRHLWPEFRRLIALCRPPVVFGEQVASKAGRAWLAGVRADLEALGYAVGAADLCAAGVGAPHIRQRLYWVAYSNERGRAEGEAVSRQSAAISCVSGAPDGWPADASGHRAGDDEPERGRGATTEPFAHGEDDYRLADSEGDGLARRQAARERRAGSSHDCRMDDADCAGSQRRRVQPGDERRQRSAWSASSYVQCFDGKSRRVGTGVRPLAHGVPGRVGQLRGYGNAIVPQVAAAFVKAFMESIHA